MKLYIYSNRLLCLYNRVVHINKLVEMVEKLNAEILTLNTYNNEKNNF